MDKTIIMNEIDEYFDSYCEGCFLKTTVLKRKGRLERIRFCIKTCTIGEQLHF